MNTTNKFIVRSNNQPQAPIKGDALRLIEFILATDPNIVIDPTSRVYTLAVKQYNELIKNTLERPSVPKWFCGIVDPTSSQLLLGLSDTQLRSVNGFTTPISGTSTEVNYISGDYLIDKNLEFGTPGSPGYVKLADDIELGNLLDGFSAPNILVTEFESIFEEAVPDPLEDVIENPTSVNNRMANG